MAEQLPIPLHLDYALQQYSKGLMTAAEAQKIVKSFGWSVNLRKTRLNPIDIFDSNGTSQDYHFKRGGAAISGQKTKVRLDR